MGVRDCLVRALRENRDFSHGVVACRVIGIESKSLAHCPLGFREKIQLQAHDTKIVWNRGVLWVQVLSVRQVTQRTLVILLLLPNPRQVKKDGGRGITATGEGLFQDAARV